MTTSDFIPAGTPLCGDIFATSRHNQQWLYICQRPAGHDGLCLDNLSGGIQWRKVSE